MTRLELSALRANDSLGMLAALGVLELCTVGLDIDARLGWSGPTGVAVVDVPYADVTELAQALAAYADELARSGRLTPAHDPGLITPPLGTKARKELEDAGALDPMRMPADTAVRRFESLQDGDLAGSGVVDASWLTALVGQLSRAKREAAERRLTPLYSPSGQMTMHQLFRDALHDVVTRPLVLAEALSGWRRVPGAGANLDSRALVDAADASAGKPANRHVPGATWLALHAAPWFTQVGDGVSGEAVSWSYPPGGARLRYPIWTPLLAPAAVRVVLSHPAARWRANAQPAEASAAAEQRRMLGICALYEARRRALSKSAGPLLPPEPLWQG
jgi:hypothetical protein